MNGRALRFSAGGFVFLAGAFCSIAVAQVLPGNGTVQGSFYFRYLGVDTSNGNAAVSALGTLTFDGKGSYQVTGTEIVGGSTADQSTSLTGSGTYSVRSSGALTMPSPFSKQTLSGAVGIGDVLVASSTDSPVCDLFVAIPVSTSASSATLSGNYYVASMEIPNGNFGGIRHTFSSFSADGKGSLGNAVISGMAANLKNQPMSQTSPGATDSMGVAGNGSLTLPAPAGVAADSELLAGSKTLYVSADGNIFLAGTASGCDMVIGVKALSGTSNTHPLNGIYFTGILQDDTTPNGFGLYASQGAANEVASTGVELAYERANSPIDGYYDYTSANHFSFTGSGTVAYSDSQFAAGAGGNLSLSSGYGGVYQLGLYVKAPQLTGCPYAIARRMRDRV